MGATQAMGMAEEAKAGRITLRQALDYHLTANHYPPVGFMADVCMEAIAAYKAGDIDREIDLDNWCTFRGRDTAPAGAIIRNYHLEFFLT